MAAYTGADRLDPYGFSGWIGREPHGAAKADCGAVRDGVFAEQVVELFGELAGARRDGPWLAVASFVNPHDIAFNGWGWEALLGFGPIDDDTVPAIPEPPSQADSFAGRPACQEAFVEAWPAMLYEQPTDEAYRRLYYYLHKLVDRAIGRILEALEQSGMAEDTVVVFTSDHGDLLGAHGGLMQKWYNAYDEAIRVPLVVRGPGVAATPGGVHDTDQPRRPAPHAAGPGRDRRRARRGRGRRASTTRPSRCPAGTSARCMRGSATAESVAAPLYFMTEDDVGRGLHAPSIVTGKEYEPVPYPSHVESVITPLAHRRRRCGRGVEAQPLLRATRRVRPGARVAGRIRSPRRRPSSAWELHNLTADPEERENRAADAPGVFRDLQGVLDEQREAKRRVPQLRNRST